MHRAFVRAFCAALFLWGCAFFAQVPCAKNPPGDVHRGVWNLPLVAAAPGTRVGFHPTRLLTARVINFLRLISNVFPRNHIDFCHAMCMYSPSNTAFFLQPCAPFYSALCAKLASRCKPIVHRISPEGSCSNSWTAGCFEQWHPR